MIHKLQNHIKTYSWGSRYFLQQLLGMPDLLGKPAAELWIGAHPLGSSRLEGSSECLDQYIQTNPAVILGKAAAFYKGKLPYLFKILAIAEPLSIQLHPNKNQAEEGFSRENQAGILLDHPSRNYKDDNHKPELVVALSEFSALCGLRLYPQIVSFGKSLSWHKLLPSFEEFARLQSELSFRQFFITLLGSTAKQLAEILDLTQQRLRGNTLIPLALQNLFHSLREKYPFDIGLLFPFLLNHIQLNPGEGIFLPAGILHAYLHGNAIEVMASSDNVIRAGLTPKHIDLAEFDRICRFDPFEPQVLWPGSTAQKAHPFTYNTPVQDFRLRILDLSDTEAYLCDTANLPAMIFCLEGSFSLPDLADHSIPYSKTDSLFIDANQAPFRITGKARLVLIDMPL